MTEKTDREIIQDIYKAVVELTTVVLGVQGQGGILEDIRELRAAALVLTTKTEKETIETNKLLTEARELQPRLEILEACINDKEKGLLPRVVKVEIRGKDNRSMIIWVLGTGLSLLLVILGLILAHLNNP